MLTNLSLGTHHSDRLTVITDATWSEYETLELDSCLVSFRNGVITIVSPGLNHETIADLIRAIIWGYCRSHQLLPFTFNQTRLKEEGHEGKEPDVAYSFGHRKEKPDLAIEVNLTSGSIDDLTKYRYLHIREVWLWERGQIRFFEFREQQYLETKSSFCLSGLNSERVTEIVNSYFGRSPLEVEDLFTDS